MQRVFVRSLAKAACTHPRGPACAHAAWLCSVFLQCATAGAHMTFMCSLARLAQPVATPFCCVHIMFRSLPRETIACRCTRSDSPVALRKTLSSETIAHTWSQQHPRRGSAGGQSLPRSFRVSCPPAQDAAAASAPRGPATNARPVAKLPSTSSTMNAAPVAPAAVQVRSFCMVVAFGACCVVVTWQDAIPRPRHR